MLVVAAALGACERDATPPAKVVVIEAPHLDDPVPWIRDRLAENRDRQVLVYIGATWCDPCRRFHEAVTAGQLDAAFPHLTLLVFDQDRDGDGLLRAGYTSEYIPLFVRPAPDGTATTHLIQGAEKGDDAVASITPRLRKLLGMPALAPAPPAARQ